MPAKTPTRHWEKPGRGKNIGSPYESRYVPATYCGRRIVVDVDWALGNRWTTSALAEYTDEGPELVTCKACLKIGYKHQAFAPAIRGGVEHAQGDAGEPL